eukprot:m.1979 g.1979  ORF g.1979 m.1979 type:complete len:97 (+) comp8128_c0_seq1:8-298(+)
MASRLLSLLAFAIILMCHQVHVLGRSLVQSKPEGDCTFTSNCKCVFENGWSIDLTPLNNYPGFFDVHDDVESYTYNISLCSEFNIKKLLQCHGMSD